MKIGSLCSGYGGLDLATEQFFDAETVWHCEYEPAPSKILATHWDIPNHHDLTTTDWTTVEPVDIITAGFPCQPFSLAGSRSGEDDERHLWPHIAEAIRFLRPGVVVLENVPGLISSGGEFSEPIDRCVCGWPYRRGGLHRDIQVEREESPPDLLGASRCGYDHEGGDGVAVTAPRVRRNDFTQPGGDGAVGRSPVLVRVGVGSSEDAEPDSAVPANERRAGRGGPSGRTDRLSVSACGEGAAGMDGRGTSALRDAEDADARAEREGAFDTVTGDRVTVCVACGRPVGDAATRSVFRYGLGEVLRSLAAIGYDAQWQCVRASDVGAPHKRERCFILACDTNGVAGPQCLELGRRPESLDESGEIERIVGSGGLPHVEWGSYSPAIERWEQVIGRSAPPPTEPGRNGQRLSPLLVEWVMGLPEGWVTGIDITRNEKLKALGNGVVPQQAYAALTQLSTMAGTP